MSEEKMKLKATRSGFEIRGITFSTKSEKTFKTSEKGFRMLNFGIRKNPSENIFLNLQSSKPKQVYWSVPVKGEDKKRETVAFDYGKEPSTEGAKMIGAVGIKLHKDDEVKYFHPYDAWEYLKENLEDGMSVFVKGNIEYSSYKDNQSGDVRKSRKFVLNAIFATNEPIDFESEKFEERAVFNQDVIVLGWEPIEGSKETVYLNAGIVGYNNYEVVQFETISKVADTLKKNLRKYHAVTVNGVISSEGGAVEIPAEQDDDGWGTKDTVGVQRKPTVAKILVTGATPASVDTETYSEKLVDSWIKYCDDLKASKEKSNPANFETQDGWGSKTEIEDEDPWK